MRSQGALVDPSSLGLGLIFFILKGMNDLSFKKKNHATCHLPGYQDKQRVVCKPRFWPSQWCSEN